MIYLGPALLQNFIFGFRQGLIFNEAELVGSLPVVQDEGYSTIQEIRECDFNRNGIINVTLELVVL